MCAYKASRVLGLGLKWGGGINIIAKKSGREKRDPIHRLQARDAGDFMMICAQKLIRLQVDYSSDQEENHTYIRKSCFLVTLTGEKTCRVKRKKRGPQM